MCKIMSGNICFYSNQCKVCKAFFTELADTPFKGDFKYICVDTTPRNRLPGYLKKVPTLIVAGENEPLVGNEVINWLWIRKMQDPRINKKESSNAQEGAGGAGGDMGLGFWNPLEMGSSGDSYSFLDQDTSVEGDGGYTMAQNFEFVGGGGGPAAMRGDQMQGNYGGGQMQSQKKSAKEEQFDKEMERYMTMRNQGVPQQIKRM
jgi:hypothetical protein